MAARTRSRASCTAVSGNPTMVNAGSADAKSTSTSTMDPSSPTTAQVNAFASMATPLGEDSQFGQQLTEYWDVWLVGQSETASEALCELWDLGKDNPLLLVVKSEHKVIEKVGPPQQERRRWCVHKEATDRQFYGSQPERQLAQSRSNAALFDACHLDRGERVPVQADLSRQTARS